MPDLHPYRLRAQESFRRAELGQTESDKAIWLTIAAQWLELATRVEEMTAEEKREA